jgi:hypothetical protein
MKSCHEIPFKVPQQRSAQMKNGHRRWSIMQQAQVTSLIWRIQSLLVPVVFVGDGAVFFSQPQKHTSRVWQPTDTHLQAA